MKNKYVWIGLRWVLGGIFIYASYYKILSPGAFAQQIYNYKLLPSWAINPLAITLPWLQLLCGIGLIVNRMMLGASACVAGMMLAFQAGLAAALLRGLNVACGCFKSGGTPATWFTFGRDSLILLGAVVVLWHVLHRRTKSQELIH